MHLSIYHAILSKLILKTSIIWLHNFFVGETISKMAAQVQNELVIHMSNTHVSQFIKTRLLRCIFPICYSLCAFL